MSSRESILSAVRAAQPEHMPLPDMQQLSHMNDNGDINSLVNQFMNTLVAIGGRAEIIAGREGVHDYIRKLNKGARSVTAVAMLNDLLEPVYRGLDDAHSLQNVDHAVIEASLAVAENGAVWVTEEDMQVRALPFISQHLIAIINAKAIVPDMHHAYQKIAGQTYGFATFIAGPSKTADIEQSLVLGAHGPRSMTVLVVVE